MNPWKCTHYRKIYTDPSIPAGLRFRFEKGVHEEIRTLFLDFGKWLRKNYAFPIRVTIYVKTCSRVRLLSGTMAYGSFRWFGDFDAPYIRIPVGDYPGNATESEREAAADSILSSLVHELTHYLQWANRFEQSDRSSEWQANYYRYRIIDLFLVQTKRQKLLRPN